MGACSPPQPPIMGVRSPKMQLLARFRRPRVVLQHGVSVFLQYIFLGHGARVGGWVSEFGLVGGFRVGLGCQ